MLKRNPFIAVLISIIAIIGAVWALYTVVRYTLYNPLDQEGIDSVPYEARTAPSYDFAGLNPPKIADVRLDQVNAIDSIPWQSSKDSSVTSLLEREREYAIKARTHAAFDPFADEILREMLRDLIAMRANDMNDRIALALTIYTELADVVGDAFFREKLYLLLMRETTQYSLDNPNIFPLRLAEVKANAYYNKLLDASLALERHDIAFNSAMMDKVGALKNEQSIGAQEKIFQIRDYLINKTSVIEQEAMNSGKTF